MSDRLDRLKGLGDVLRFTLAHTEGDRVFRHLAGVHAHETWELAHNNPSALSGPHPIEGEKST